VNEEEEYEAMGPPDATGGANEKDQDLKELMELQRKYRMMMGDRKAFDKHAKSKMRQQSTTLNRVQSENEAMKSELSAHVPKATANKLNTQAARLNRLNEEEEQLIKKITLEKKQAEDLNKQHEFLARKLKTARDSSGPTSSRDSQAFIMKQVRVLENRLDKALVKYNEALSKNKDLRSTIDDLRREKNVYYGIYKKLEKELNEKKRVMAAIIEMSNQAYEARDNSEHEIELIKRQMKEREELWEAELKQLNQKLNSFERVSKMLNEEQHRGSMTIEEETALKKKVRGGAWVLAGEKTKLAEKKEVAESYEDMFLRIQQATKIDDIEVLVESFIEAEDRNFSLFNYVNELTMEVEKLEEAIGEHQADLEKELDDDSNMNTRSKKIIKDLEDKLVKTEAKAEHYEAKLRQTAEEMEIVYNVVESMFSKLGCEQLANTEILGSGGVGESNIMLYLGVIEQRKNEVINQYISVMREESGEAPEKPAPPPESNMAAAEEEEDAEDYKKEAEASGEQDEAGDTYADDAEGEAEGVDGAAAEDTQTGADDAEAEGAEAPEGDADAAEPEAEETEVAAEADEAAVEEAGADGEAAGEEAAVDGEGEAPDGEEEPVE